MENKSQEDLCQSNIINIQPITVLRKQNNKGEKNLKVFPIMF